MANTVKGSVVAGSRGYFLTGMGMRLNQALIAYAVQFLSERGHTMVQVRRSERHPRRADSAQRHAHRCLHSRLATPHALPAPCRRRRSR